jgi:hypothetical protein
VKQFTDQRYKINAMVGKKADQVGRTSNGEITGNDAELYDKLTQSSASAYDLISQTLARKVKAPYAEFIAPVLVIPDDQLWIVEYQPDGQQQSAATPAKHCSLFIDQTWKIQNWVGQRSYQLTHLEIVTFSYLKSFIVGCFHGDTCAFPVSETLS